MELNKGDKLLCKKDSDVPGIRENVWYEIIDDGRININGLNCDPPVSRRILVTCSDKHEIYNFAFFTRDGEYNIWDYFYTNKELRKEKIKKLNDTNR